ncbi:MAG: tyrosine recombinase [Alphaproteobacteria bacterium]
MDNHKFLIERFFEMLQAERHASLNTVLSYKKDLLDFFSWILSSALSFEHLTTKQLQQYLSNLYDKSYSQSTIIRRISSLKQFYNFLISENIVLSNPVISLDVIKSVRSMPKVLSVEEIKRLLDFPKKEFSPEDLRLITLLEVLYASGLRVSELVSLPMKSVVICPKIKEIQNYLYIKGKGDKERLVPLNASAVFFLKRYVAVYSYFSKKVRNKGHLWLFPSSGKNGHLTRQRFGQMLKQRAQDVGLAPSKVSPHVLRHAFATHLLQNGLDLLTLKKFLGHADIATTQIYTHVLPKHIEKLVAKHHPLK